MEHVSGNLFAGEAKLFFAHPRRQRSLPFPVETADTTNHPPVAVSFNVHVHNADLIMLCDSRLNATRVVNALCASDIGGADTDVPAYGASNAGRWTSLRETSDGRHWSEGEYHRKGMLTANSRSAEERQTSVLSCLNAQLPPTAVEAVREGRAIIISRTNNIAKHVTPKRTRSNGRNVGVRALYVRRLCKSFANHVYELRVAPSVDAGDDSSSSCSGGESIALLFVGRFWPKDATRQATMTVARTRPLNGATTAGGRVFCICLGDHLKRMLDGCSAEEIAKTKRHYEGYFTDHEFGSFLRKPKPI